MLERIMLDKTMLMKIMSFGWGLTWLGVRPEWFVSLLRVLLGVIQRLKCFESYLGVLCVRPEKNHHLVSNSDLPLGIELTWVWLEFDSGQTPSHIVLPCCFLTKVFLHFFLGSAQAQLGSDLKHQVEKLKSIFFTHSFTFSFSCFFMMFSKSLACLFI